MSFGNQVQGCFHIHNGCEAYEPASAMEKPDFETQKKEKEKQQNDQRAIVAKLMIQCLSFLSCLRATQALHQAAQSDSVGYRVRG